MFPLAAGSRVYLKKTETICDACRAGDRAEITRLFIQEQTPLIDSYVQCACEGNHVWLVDFFLDRYKTVDWFMYSDLVMTATCANQADMVAHLITRMKRIPWSSTERTDIINKLSRLCLYYARLNKNAVIEQLLESAIRSL